MKYVLGLVMALVLGTVAYGTDCHVNNLRVVNGYNFNRQLITQHYAAPVRERVVVEYAEVPVVKERITDYYGNSLETIVDRSRNKEIVRIEKQQLNNHNRQQQRVVEKVKVVEKQQNLRDRVRDRRNNQKVKEVRIVERQQVNY